MIASSVADLHSDNNKINKQTALTEEGRHAARPQRHAQQARHPDGLAA